MPTKRKETIVEKEGIRFIQSVVEGRNDLFHDLKDDFGLDGQIELVDNEVVLGHSIGVQIKSGSSYCSIKTCHIPSDKRHFEYWKRHSLTIVGIVYDPNEKNAYWVNISNYLDQNGGAIDKGPYQITFNKSDLSKFDTEFYHKVFIPLFLRKPLQLDLEEAIQWAVGEDFDKHCLGIGTLQYLFLKLDRVWKIFFQLFKDREVSKAFCL